MNFTREFAVAARHALWSCGISPRMTHKKADAVKSLVKFINIWWPTKTPGAGWKQLSFYRHYTWVLTVCALMQNSSAMVLLEYPEVGILELRFQGLVQLKAGLHPWRPPLGRIFKDSDFKKRRRKLEGPVGETGFPARTGLFDFPNFLLQLPYTNSFITM